MSHIINNLKCCFYSKANKDIHHNFFNCNQPAKIWGRYFQWLQFPTALHNEPLQNFLASGSILDGKKNCHVVDVMWIAVVSLIWRTRNDQFFNNINPIATKIWEEIKARAWSWLSGKGDKVRIGSFLELSKCPRISGEAAIT